MDTNIREAASSFFISVGAILIVFFVIYAGVAQPWEAVWSSMWTSLGWTEAIGPQGAEPDGPVTIEDGAVPQGGPPSAAGEKAGGISIPAVILELSGILFGIALTKTGAALRENGEARRENAKLKIKGPKLTVSAA